MKMKRIFDFFKKKETKSIEVPSESAVFDVENFNRWFNDPNNNAVYANPGIFLRTDKLSESHIMDYLEKCHGIKNGGPFLEMVAEFEERIREDWRKRIAQ